MLGHSYICLGIILKKKYNRLIRVAYVGIL